MQPVSHMCRATVLTKKKFFCGFWDEIPFDVPFDVIASTGSPVCMMCSQKDKYQDLGPSLENCIN